MIKSISEFVVLKFLWFLPSLSSHSLRFLGRTLCIQNAINIGSLLIEYIFIFLDFLFCSKYCYYDWLMLTIQSQLIIFVYFLLLLSASEISNSTWFDQEDQYGSNARRQCFIIIFFTSSTGKLVLEVDQLNSLVCFQNILVIAFFLYNSDI